ncbi:MAG TPA: glycosyltransferase family 4 protein [Actinomycetota bacterium]|nr:glycosyltransferase family 4 protein [Actinomycetota bacterium]
MKVLVVTNDFPPRVGGINGYVAELMRRFPQGEVVVFASDWPGAGSFDPSYPHPVIRWPLRGMTMYPTAAVRDHVEDVVRRERPDILLFGAAVPLGLIGLQIHRRLGIPYATFTHGVEVWAGQVPVTRRVLGRVVRGAALSMGVSRWAIDLLRQVVGPDPWIELMPPGIDVERFHPEVSDAEVRDRHGLGDAPVICCVSRLTLRKGQDKVIRALPWILREIPDVRFLVVGTGPDLERLQNLAYRKRVTDRVIFAGEVREEVLPQYFRAGDVFAMPCRTRKLGLEAEAFGIVFVQASAVGRPCVAGDSGGAPEAVLHGETGLVVDGNEVDEVAEGILDLLGDPARAAKLGTAGSDRVHREFTWEAMSSRLRGLLIDALAGG